MFKSGEIIIANEKYKGKFLYEGIICEVDKTDPKKVKILTGPGKGRRVLFDATKMEKYDGEIVDNEPKAKFQKHARVTILTHDQFDILGRPKETYYSDDVASIQGEKAVVTEVIDYDAQAEQFQLEVEIKSGNYEGCRIYLLENELQEYYQSTRKFRISFLDEDDVHHTEVIEAESLEQARDKVGPIKQEFYHMAL